jgi:hypothetical protein
MVIFNSYVSYLNPIDQILRSMDLAKKKQLGDSQGHNVVPQYVDSKQLFPVKFTYV